MLLIKNLLLPDISFLFKRCFVYFGMCLLLHFSFLHLCLFYLLHVQRESGQNINNLFCFLHGQLQ